MKHLKFKKPAKKKVLLIIIGLAGLAVMYLYFWLPGVTKNFLVSQAEKFGLKNMQFKALHVGWQRLDLADVTVGDGADPALRIPYLSMEYSLAGLWHKKIKNIHLVGARITIEDRGQGFQFQGMTAPVGPKAQNGENVSIERLSIEEGILRLVWGKHSVDIPFAATLSALGPNYSFAALLCPLAETVRLQGTADKKFKAGKIAIGIPGFPLQTLIDQAGFGSTAWGKGRIAAQGEIILREGNFKSATISVSSMGNLMLAVPDQASVMLDSFSLAFNLGRGFTVRDIVASVQGRQLRFGEWAIASPFHLDILGPHWPDLEFSFHDLQVDRPLPVKVERITGKITGPRAAAQINGDFRLQTGNRMLEALGLPGKIIQPYSVDGEFHGSLMEGNTAWTMKARGQRGISIAFGRESLRGQLDMNASMSGDAQRLHASVACRVPSADLQLAEYCARGEMLSGSAELDYVYGGKFSGRGLVNIRGGNVAPSAGNGLAVSGVRLKLPWHWPVQGPGEEGKFSVARLQSNGMHWQDISGILFQKDASLRFSGAMHSALEKITATFQGYCALNTEGNRLQADFLIPPVVLPVQTELQPLHPILQGVKGGGQFQSQGRIWAGNDSAGGSAIVKIVDADFDQQGKGIALRGVNAEIKLNSLFDFVTAPDQRIGFRELKWNDMSFLNGEFVFSGENGGIFFIESGRLDWCQGKIVMAPFRLEPGKTDFLITFFCDRVNFAQMLNALLGKTIASGDAEMSGIVPVKMIKGSPVFLEGYLYSTPGSSGNLKISQPELISRGQVLVEEAIRDFRYNWIKVKMNSQNDRLDMIVSIDGAPAQKLPLLYDPKQKNFIKDPSGGRHVELKGLLLEIRFSDIDLKYLLKASSQMTVSYKEN